MATLDNTFWTKETFFGNGVDLDFGSLNTAHRPDPGLPYMADSVLLPIDLGVTSNPERSFVTSVAHYPIVLENAPTGTFVVVAGGVTRLPVQYELTDDADGRFDIDSQTGLITVADGSKIDHESSDAHQVEVTTTFLIGGTAPVVDTLTIFVRDVNEAPTAITLDNATVEENAVGAIIGVVTTDDEDIGDTHAYQSSDIRFEVVGDQLKLKDGVGLDHESEPSVTLTITATDEGGLGFEQAFTIDVGDVNEAPVAVDDEGGTTENAAATIDVLANDTDVDDGDDSGNFSLDSVSIASVTGLIGAGTGVVSIDGNQLRFEPGTDFDELDEGDTATVVVDYTTSDDDGLSAAAQATITVTGVNDAPVVADVTAAAIEDGPAVSGSFLGDDVDADDDGSTLTYTLTSLPSEGLVADIDNEIFTFDPEDDFQDLGDGETRDVTFGYTATDSQGAVSNTATVTITVTGVNDAPTLDVNTGKTVAEGSVELLSVTELSASDPDDTAAEIVYTVTTAPAHGHLALSDNTGAAITEFTQADLAAARVVYVHDGGEAASDSFIFDVDDPDGAGPESQLFAIAVTPVNDAPTLDVNTGKTVNEGSAELLSVTELSASDPDNTAAEIVYTVTTAPAHGHLALSDNQGTAITEFTQEDLAAARVVYVHDGGEAASDSFIFNVDDPDGAGPESQLFAITVAPVNDAPTLDVNALNIQEGETKLIGPETLRASDSDSGTDDLTFTIGDLVAGRFERVSNPGVAIDEFTQAELDSALIQFVHDGGEQPPAYTVTLSDGLETIGPFAADISFEGVNDPPVVEDVALSAAEDGAAVSASFVGDDVDPDDDGTTLIYDIASSPGEGGVSDNGDGTFTFDPGAGFQDLAEGETRDVTFDYTATDSHGAVSNTAVATITVGGVNDAPVVEDVTASAVEDGAAVTGSFSGDDPDSDDDGTTLTYVLATLPSEGIVVDIDGDTFTFDAGIDFQDLAEGETRDVTFDYTATDVHGAVSNTGTVTVTVTGVNDAPVVEGVAASASEDGSTVTASFEGDDVDSDDNGTTLTYAIISSPGEGGVANNGDGTFTFDPGAGFQDLAEGEIRDVTFEYIATDSHGAVSNTAVATITVGGVNDAPVVEDVTASASEDGAAVTGSFAGDDEDSDDDGTTLTYVLATLPSEGIVVDIDGDAFTFDPGTDFQDLAEGETRDVTFDYTASDAHGAVSNTGVVTITVTGVNDAPVVEDVTVSASEDGAAVTAAFVGDDVDSDDDGTTLTYAITPAASLSPSEGGVVNNGDGTFTFDPGTDFQDLAEGETRDVIFDTTATDRHGEVSDTGTVTVTVTGVNDAPVVEDVAVSAVEDGAAVTGSFVGNDVDSDDDGTTLTYALSSSPSEGGVVDNGDGTFTFDPGTGFQDLAEGESRDVTFNYVATDSHGAVSNTGVVTVTVTGVNDAPMDLSLSNNRVGENASSGTIVGTLWATDPDTEDGFVYELTDDAGGAFDIDPITGRLAVGNPLVLDFENPEFEGVYSVEVSVTDPVDGTYTERMDIVLTDFNEAPTGIESSGGEVLANPANGTVVAELTTIDPDTTGWSPIPETFTYALLDNARGRFTLDGDEIVVADGARIDQGNDYELLVRSTDKGGLSVDQVLIISANPPPPAFSAILLEGDVSQFAGDDADVAADNLLI